MTQIIDNYIKDFPTDVQDILNKIKHVVKAEAPEATEAMSYGIPTFKLNDKNLVHFGAYENHIGFYPTPAGIEAFKEEFSKYKGAKGSVQFPLDEPIPYDLITKVVKHRVASLSK